MRLGVLCSGSGTNLQAILDATRDGVLRDIAEVAVVISDRPGARALDRARAFDPPVAAVFVDPGIPPDRELLDKQIVRVLREHEVDIVCLAGYMRIVGSALLEAFPDRVLNIHPALLPSFPGLHAQRRALDHGVRITGCTVHFVDDGVDTGPIIIQAAVPVFDADDTESLARRILEQEHHIYPEAIRLLCQGRLERDDRHVRVRPETAPSTVPAALICPQDADKVL